jgi:pyrroline-5-carboxylate reductase
MGSTVGIIKDEGGCASIADEWPRASDDGPELLVSPPVSWDEVGRRAGTVIVDVSEGALGECLAALGAVAGPQTAIVTSCPVVPLSAIRSYVGDGPALFRAVAPLGTAPGDGLAAVAPEPGTAKEITERVKAALAWIGAVEIVTEDALDAVAALAIGGAGFLCEALQGLEEGAVRDGLPRETARAFAHHTLLATALLLRDCAGSPADLKDQVASPGGTTIAALASLEDAGVRGAYIRAVQRTAVEVRRRRDAARSGVVE